MTENTPPITPDVPAAPEARDVFSPAAIVPDALARMLGVPAEVVTQHIATGAPVNRDGTVNLIHYAAWLNTPPREQGDADVGASDD